MTPLKLILAVATAALVSWGAAFTLVPLAYGQDAAPPIWSDAAEIMVRGEGGKPILWQEQEATYCSEKQFMFDMLANTYQEFPYAAGLNTVLNYVAMMFVSADLSSFTMVNVFANGKACMVSAGTDMEYSKMEVVPVVPSDEL